jgi:hypothetical protein
MRPRIQKLVIDIKSQEQRIITKLATIYELSYDLVRKAYYKYECKIEEIKIVLSMYKKGIIPTI